MKIIINYTQAFTCSFLLPTSCCLRFIIIKIIAKWNDENLIRTVKHNIHRNISDRKHKKVTKGKKIKVTLTVAVSVKNYWLGFENLDF